MTAFYSVISRYYFENTPRMYCTVETAISNDVPQNVKTDRKVKRAKKARTVIEPKRLASIASYIDSNDSLKSRKDVIISALKEKEKGVYLMDEVVASNFICTS